MSQMWYEINITHVHVKGFYLGGKKLSCSLILSPSFPETSYNKVKDNCTLLVGNNYQGKVTIKSKVNVLSVHTRTHSRTHAHTHTHACMHKHIWHACTERHACILVHIYAHMYTHTCIHTYMHTSTHIHAHPHTRSHIYTDATLYTYIQLEKKADINGEHLMIIMIMVMFTALISSKVIHAEI